VPFLALSLTVPDLARSHGALQDQSAEARRLTGQANAERKFLF